MADELVTAAEHAAKQARRAVVLAFVAVAIAAAVLAIDHGIKRAIISEAQKASGILDEFKVVSDAAREAAGLGGTASGASQPAGDGVGDDPPAPAETPDHAGNGLATPRRRSGSGGGRARGDG